MSAAQVESSQVQPETEVPVAANAAAEVEQAEETVQSTADKVETKVDDVAKDGETKKNEVAKDAQEANTEKKSFFKRLVNKFKSITSSVN